MQIHRCHKYAKDIKHINGKCKGKDIEKQSILPMLEEFLNKPDNIRNNFVLLYQKDNVFLYKTRIIGCNLKRKDARLIFCFIGGIDAILLIRSYLKSEIENIASKDLIDDMIECLEEFTNY